MKEVGSYGGTDMLKAIKEAAEELNEEAYNYPGYVSAMQFIGDGGDGCGNKDNIGRFMVNNDEETGFGEHMHSAVFMGDEAQRKVLAEIFGDDETTVAEDFEDLIEGSMHTFAENIEEYVRNKTL